MTFVSHHSVGVERTRHGLSIAGTRVTLYQLMDYIHAGDDAANRFV